MMFRGRLTRNTKYRDNRIIIIGICMIAAKISRNSSVICMPPASPSRNELSVLASCNEKTGYIVRKKLGVTPTTRLKARLNANSEAYPTDCATSATDSSP